MKITDIANMAGKSDAAIKKALSRAGISYSSKDELQSEALKFLAGHYNLDIEGIPGENNPGDNDPPNPKSERKEESNRKFKKEKTKLEKYARIAKNVLPRLPLPMLGLPASYGVYYFSSHFLPLPMAIIEGAGFELIYIGLSVKEFSGKKLELANMVMVAAVAVSVVYNTIAGFIHFNEMVMTNLHLAFKWLLAFIHGAPLAILGYFVARLTLHK